MASVTYGSIVILPRWRITESPARGWPAEFSTLPDTGRGPRWPCAAAWREIRAVARRSRRWRAAIADARHEVDDGSRARRHASAKATSESLVKVTTS